MKKINLKNFKKGLDKYKQRCYNKNVPKRQEQFERGFNMLKDLVKANKVCMGKSNKTSGNEYSVVLRYNGNCITMLYHDNYLNESGKDEFLYALLMDGLAYENCFNLADFMVEFGYEDEDKARKVYKACERQCNKLHRLFTVEEIEQLQEEFEDF